MSQLIRNKMKIGYFGSEDSFTHLAALKRFGREHQYISISLISQLFENVISGIIDIAVVPIENSTGGTVYDTVDELVGERFAESNVKIEEELYLEIILNLLSKSSLSKIKKVYSHPFPIHFCREWLRVNLPAAQIIEVNSTSEAAKLASEEKTSAAIASIEAAKTYGLNLITQDIGREEPNVTHFFVLSKLPIASKRKKEKTAVAFSLRHKVGKLYAALGVLAKPKINLTRIISRPFRGKVGEYKFFIELEGDISEAIVKITLAKFKEQTMWMNTISSYPSIKLKRS